MEESSYLTFKKYTDITLATEIGEFLRLNGIPYHIEDERQFFDSSFAGNKFDADIHLKLKGGDFVKAHAVLAQYYKKQLNKVNADYYLFDFSDRELIEIISKRDEWGDLDYQLAQVLLADRGIEINPELADELQEKRIKELSKPEIIHKQQIISGYTSAIAGGLLAIIFGTQLASSKKTLPDGSQVYAYEEEERKHGKRIVVTGVICLVLWVAVIIYLKSQR